VALAASVFNSGVDRQGPLDPCVSAPQPHTLNGEAVYMRIAQQVMHNAVIVGDTDRLTLDASITVLQEKSCLDIWYVVHGECV
jgi:hypothetical protein